MNCEAAFINGNKRLAKALLRIYLRRTRLRVAAARRTGSLSFQLGGILVNRVSLLHLAAYWGWTDIAILLVTVHHCSVRWKDSKGNVPLHYAAYNDHLEMVKCFITELHCNPLVTNKHMVTPLHLACLGNGQLNMVQYFINELHCEQQSCVDNDGNTPLHYACHVGKLNIVQYLINEAHYNPSCVSNTNETLLHHACIHGHLNIVQYLISEAHCNPSCVDSTGETPLHTACHPGHLNIIQYLISEAHCNPSCVNNIGITPLHIACYYGHLNITQYLISEAHCNLSGEVNEYWTPLTVACSRGHLSIVQYLIEEAHCDPSSKHIRKPGGDVYTPLHIACIYGHLNITHYLIIEAHCNPSCVSNKGDTPLQIACFYGHLNIVQYLISEAHCNSTWSVDEFWTPLILACSRGHLSIVQYLIEEVHCDPSSKHIRKPGGDVLTPLHIACIYGRLNITKYLISKAHCNPSCAVNEYWTPLTIACFRGHLSIVQYLIEEAHCDPSSKHIHKPGGDVHTPLHIACIGGHLNITQYLISEGHCNPSSEGYTPLDFACVKGHLNIVQYLISELHCNTSCVNIAGDTPLHTACNNGHLNVIQYLISEAHCNPSCENSDGDTPLHLACIYDDYKIVQYLLSTGKVNPLAKNKDGESSLTIASGNYDIIKLLQPFVDYSKDYPVHTFTKLILTGDSGTGKTTIAQHITSILSASRTNSSSILSAGRTNSFIDITSKQYFTAGIIPHHIRSRRLQGNFVMYDFAGQQEYYSSHDAILEQVMRRSASIFLCIIDLTKSKEKICQSLQYWLTFINNACSKAKMTSHVLIIGSHADQVTSEKVKEEKSSLLQEIATSRAKGHKYSLTGYITMDCRRTDTGTSRQLISILTNSHKSITMRLPSISYYCHLLYGFLCTELKVVGCTLHDLRSFIAKKKDVSLPNDPSILKEFLTILSDKGLILFIQHTQSSWIVVKTDILMNDINGTLFAPHHFKEHRDFASNTGIVPKSNLSKVFPQYNLEMLVGFLVSLDFCRPVDPSVLQYSHTNLQITPSHSTGGLLFFPGLVQSDRPCSDTILQFGWCLRCMNPCEFFSSRFLHVLLLSVAYKFPLATPGLPCSSVSGFQRMCKVWRNGIFWRNYDNITTVVELLDNNRCVLVAMSCDDNSSIHYAELRSSLIALVRHLQQEHCSGPNVSEFLVSPQCVSQYPFDSLPNSDLFHIHNVAQAILLHKQVVPSYEDSHSFLQVRTLPFEPYQQLRPSLICRLFNPDVADQQAPQSFLHEIRQLTGQSKMKQTVYEELRECMDRLSIFAGRNPLEVAGLKEENLPSETSSSTACGGDPSSILSIDDLADVKRFLKDFVEWKSLGLELGLLYPTLKKIKKEQHGDINDCIMEMLAAWLQQQDNVAGKGVPSWSILKKALMNIGENELADTITS